MKFWLKLLLSLATANWLPVKVHEQSNQWKFFIKIIMILKDCVPNKNGINHVPGECAKFYLCAHGVPHAIQSCGPGTAFNGQVCTWPNLAECLGFIMKV